MMKTRTALPTMSALGGLALIAALSCEPGTTPAPVEGDDDEEEEVQVALEEVAAGLVSPVALAFPNDGSGRTFIVDRVGVVRILEADGELLDEPFLDVSEAIVALREDFDERGLLGFAFHPSYAENGRFYTYYSAPLREAAPDDYDHTATISRFNVDSSDPDRADPASEEILLEVDEPQFNHDGGTLAFGPDGHLYISLGDGGGANDTGLGHPPLGNGQDVSTLLGNILRIDVDGDAPYDIPEDNPLVDVDDARPEIFAYGFRNPYRFSFDMGGERELFVGDAGQNLWEEVSIVERGQNYGWNIREGTHCFDPDNPEESPEECPSVGPRGQPLIPPVIEYPNSGGQEEGLGLVVVGGYVYRGDAIPALEGQYIFGDWSGSFDEPLGSLFVAQRPDGDGLWAMRPLPLPSDVELTEFVLGFGQDPEGEVYVLTTRTSGPTGETGRVWRIIPEEQSGVR